MPNNRGEWRRSKRVKMPIEMLDRRPLHCARYRLCENSSPAGDPGKTTSTVSIWRVFFGGEGSENPFFVLPKCHFGVFAQPGEEAGFLDETHPSPPPHVGGYHSYSIRNHTVFRY